jgi:hypothetical protein
MRSSTVKKLKFVGQAWCAAPALGVSRASAT